VCRDGGFRTGCGGPREPDRRRPKMMLWDIMNEMGVARRIGTPVGQREPLLNAHYRRKVRN